MPILSQAIVTAQTHPSDSTVVTVVGSAYKGDGYYGRSDGLHTVQIKLTGFIGSFKMQGTLAVDPTSNDWFDIIDTDLEYLTPTDVNELINFTGNFTWVRANLVYTDGSINFVLLNH